MSSLDDFLRLESTGNSLEGSSPLSDSVRPTASGLQWLAASQVAGMLFRYSNQAIERLQVGDDVSVTCSYPLPASVTVVQLAASPDGRLVAVACNDGSLLCLDSTSSSLSLRWKMDGAHSHVSSDASSSPSSDRSNAASASGPVSSLAFSPTDYILLLVDNTSLSLYDAATAGPPAPQTQLADVTSATWSRSSSTQEPLLSLGHTDGTISIAKWTSSHLETKFTLGSPSEEEGFCCTHMNWQEDTLIAGLCRVTPSDDEPDEDDPDDTAEHEAALFVTTLNPASLDKPQEWSELGDVVPFFAVPKSGRHVFFTSLLQSSQNLIVVATNVGSDVGAAAQEGGPWSVVEFQEGAAALTPTNEDDEYTFPVGIQVVQLASSEYRMVLASTDGSLTTFSFQNEADPNCFAAPLTKSTSPLPGQPVEASQSTSPPELANEPEIVAAPAPTSSLFGGQASFSLAPAPTTSAFSAGATETKKESGFSFGTTATPAFGSGSTSFGAPAPSSFTFGASFGAPSKLGATAQPSAFGAPTAPQATTPKGPVFGSGVTFGQASSSVSSTGFGTLASSPAGTGIFTSFGQASAAASSGFGALASTPKESQTSTPSMFGSSKPSAFGFGAAPSPSPFSPQATTSAAPAKPVEPKPEPEPEPVQEPPKAAKEPTSAVGKKAARAFDQIDEAKNGSIPAELFDQLQEELGEGFFGEEQEAQLALIDPSRSGVLLRANVIDWYETLVESGKGDDDDSLDSEERAERAEEESKARECFGKLCTTSDKGVRTIKVGDMEELITSLGSTYGEDEFRKVLKKLKQPDNTITEDSFVTWYIEWLFGDNDSDFEDEDGGDTGASAPKGGASDTKDLSSIFKVDKDSWKCEVCSVRNGGDLKKCAACETVRPGFEKEVESASGSKSTAASGSIGSGGFSFGTTAGGSIGSGGFSFGGAGGGTTGTSTGGSGFSFGGAAGGSGSGFSFGGASTSASNDKPATSGFSFGAPKPAEVTKAAAAKTATPSSTTAAASFPPMSTKAPTPFSATKASVSSSASSSAFPPMSAKAPTPFGVSSSSSSGVTGTQPSKAAFPPMSSKAPTPLSGAGKPSSSGSSSAAFPPMSSKAPTPFGAASSSTAISGASSSTTKSSAAFPPMSSKAPTPFSGAGKPSSSGSSAAAFPPMSSKAPTPFGSTSSSTADSGASSSTTKSSSAAFPPMSSKAPTPFSGGSKPSSSSSSAAAFPPMSSKAPTPFGASSSNTTASGVSSSTTKPSSAAFPPLSAKAPTPFTGENKATSSGSTSASFPPMSTKAPTPFGASSGSVGKSPSAAFPPMSTKAPTPFSGATKPSSSSASSAAFPPMSSKAPTPFGVSSSGGSTSTAKSSSASFPPMSTKAPTPFSGAGSSTSTSSTAAFPPMSSKAPTPFGGSSSGKPSSSAAFPPMSTKAPTPFSGAAKPTSSSSSSAAFPPMSAKAPTPFGASSSNSATSVAPTSTSNAAAFPPMSTKAPTPFGTSSSATTTIAPTAVKSSDASFQPLSTKAPTPFSASSDKSTESSLVKPGPTEKSGKSEKSFFGLQPGKTVSQPSRAYSQFESLVGRMEDVSSRVSRLQKSGKKDEQVAKKLSGFVSKMQQCRIDLVGIEATLLNQKDRAVFLLSRKTDASRQVSGAAKLVETNSVAARDAGELAKEQPLDLESESNRRRFATGARVVFEQMKTLSSRMNLLESVASGDDTKGTEVLRGVMSLYECTKQLNIPIKRMETRVQEIEKLTPRQQDAWNRGRSTYSLTPTKSTGRREQMRPLALPSERPSSMALKNRATEDTVSKWEKMETLLQSQGSQPTKTVHVGGLRRRALRASEPEPASVRRKPTARSLLLSPVKATSTERAPDSTRLEVFSPASASVPRDAWNRASSVDQSKVQKLPLVFPRDLEEVSVSSKARQKLASVGTTPEKLKSSMDVKSSEESRKLTRVQKGTDIVSSAETAKKEVAKKATTAFPPMSIKAPTPFSSKKESSTSTKSSSAASFPPLSSEAPKPVSLLTSTGKTNEKKSESVSQTSGQANSLFSGTLLGSDPMTKLALDNSSKAKEDKLADAAKEVSKLRQDGSPDYHQILRDFYNKHNPGKLGEVDKTLEKYKGREVEMFRKLATKYKVPSPLDSLNSTSKSAGFGDSMASAPTPFGSSKPPPSPFSTPAAPPAAASSNAPPSFGSSSAFGAPNAPAPSPFGKPATSGASPFGGPAPSTNASPFGSFGSSSTTPFGGSSSAAPTPFGATPSAQPQTMQTGTQGSFQGRNPREMLLAFYQQKNPQKIAEVDKVLQKYSGNEEMLFRNLAKKYQLDPSVFGLSGAAPAPSGTGSAFGSTTTAFGQQSSLSSGASPFGGGSAGGFGQPSTMGGMAAPSPSASTFGAAAGSAFGTSSFGALASSPSPFGAPSPGGFGSPAPSFGAMGGGGAFGGATPFGAARR